MKKLSPWLLLVIVSAWFWPALLGHRATSRHVDTQAVPMATFYHDALASGRTPTWNERDGFGTPAVADGTLGVYYPPHQLVYRLLNPASGWTLLLVVHSLGAAWFTWLCARGFGIAPAGCLLSAMIFAGQGFFISHADLSWSSTTGCWLPLAVLAAWRWLEHRSTPWLFGLVLVLGVQCLAGHFQVAWMTIVSLVLLAIGWLIVAEDRLGRLPQLGWLFLAITGGLALAAIQLVPSAELAVVGDPRGRGPTFLSSFSTPPWHLLTGYLAPFLLHHDPLWTDIAWTPWRSSPEESLPYVGLLSLGLATWTIRIAHRDKRVRLWTALLLVSLVLSLGRFVPGFDQLAGSPGFGWFPAPGRWSLVSGLCWALLAGYAVERLDTERLSAWCQGFSLCGLLLLGGATWAIVIAASDTEAFYRGPGMALSERLLEHGYTLQDLRTRALTPANELRRLLTTGLLVPALALVTIGLAGMSALPRRFPSHLPLIILLLVCLDLGLTAAVLRPVRFHSTSYRPTQQSPVLRRLAKRPGQRIISPLGRLPIAAGLSAVGSSALPDIEAIWSAQQSPGSRWWPRDWSPLPPVSRQDELGMLVAHRPRELGPDEILLMRLTGARTLLCDSRTPVPQPDGPLRPLATFDDLWLGRLVHGEAFLRDTEMIQFKTWTLPADQPAARAWFLPLVSPAEPGSDPVTATRPPPARRQPLREAQPVSRLDDLGETVSLEFTTTSPGVLVLADHHYPGWTARRRRLSPDPAAWEDAPVEIAWGSWRALKLPTRGRWQVRFTFAPPSHRTGRMISLATLATIILLGILWLRLRATGSRPIESVPAPADRPDPAP